MFLHIKVVLKKCIMVGVFILILFSINFTDVYAKEDGKSNTEETFKKIAEGFVDIEVYSRNQDGTNNTIAKGKGLFVTKNNNSSSVLLDNNLAEKVDDSSSSGGQGLNVKAILPNGVEITLSKVLSSSSLGVAVFSTGKEIKNDLTIKYALGEEKPKKNSKIFTCNFDDKNKINEAGVITDYQERNNAIFMNIGADNGYSPKRGDFIFDENGVCIGMMLNNQNATDAICMNSVSSVMKEFDVAFDGYIYTNKSKLKDAISNAESEDTSKYKKETVANFNSSIDNAKNCFENSESTTEDIEKSIKELDEAKKNLKYDLLIYIIIACVLLVLFIVLIIILVLKKKKKKRELEEEKRKERLKRIEDDLRGNVDSSSINFNKE